MNKFKKTADCNIVMYHYVRDSMGSNYPKINSLQINVFEKQIDFLMRTYKIISLDEYVFGEYQENEKLCALTFDDGLSDHYSTVFQILKKKNIVASFFPITGPMTEFKVADVHKVHFLLSKLEDVVFSSEINLLLIAMGLDEHLINDVVKKESRYRWDSILVANIKTTIAQLPYEVKDEILTILFKKYIGDEKVFCQYLYMSQKNIKKMHNSGMLFGTHTHTHPRLSYLSSEAQTLEITKSKSILEDVINEDILSFSYPNGEYKPDTVKILKENNFKYAVTTNRGDANLLNNGLYEMKRNDTKDVCF